MLRQWLFTPVRVAPARRARSASIAVFSIIAGLAPLSVGACEIALHGDQRQARASAPSDLPETLVAATLRCGSEIRPVTIWTLKVDVGAEHLGVRDLPLFQTSNTGPLRQIAEAEIPGAARLAVMVREGDVETIRSSGARARSYRRFATFCDADREIRQTAPPLDCSLNGARVKARATAYDANQDGELDVVNHEVSLYLGGDRLHVVFFSEEYKTSALSGAATWIDVLVSFGALLPGA